MSSAEERLANDPSSELWGEHRSRYRFAVHVAATHLATAAEGQAVPRTSPAAARLLADSTGHETGDFDARAAQGHDAPCTSAAAARLPADSSGHGAFLAGLAVLDVACGAGFGLDMLRQAGASAIGVDYDAAALGDVRRAQAGSRLVRADAMHLPLTDASIDLAVSFETIEHVADAHALVAELRRVLKPGGRLVLSTPNRAFGPQERHTGNPFHVREFTPDELRDELRASFDKVQLFGQRPSDTYRYVPYLMFEPHADPSALAWKLLLRLPFGVRNRLALALSGRPFYPGEDDYCFVAEACDSAHALVAVAV